MQRAFHFLIAALGLLAVLPLLLLVAIVVKLTSRGPVLYRQERVGRHFRPFWIYKFRTMVVDAERMGPGITPEGDARVTPIGRLLRTTKLDELPQLWNVVRGDMNLVGPRPELPRYVRLFQEDFRDILRRVRPGITDLASITYRNEAALLRGEDPETVYVQTILPHKLRLAREYVKRSSLAYDLVLIVETLVALAYPARAVDRVLTTLGRHHVGVAIVLQAGLAALANLAAVAIRFDGAPPAHELRLVLIGLPLLLVVRAAWFQVFNLYRDVWQYAGSRELGGIVAAVLLGSVTFWSLLQFAAPTIGYSRVVVVLDALLCIAALVGVRAARQLHRGMRGRSATPRRALLVGSDDSAERVMRGLMTHPRFDYRIVGIVGESAASGLSIHSVPILGSYDQLEGIMRDKTPDEVLVMASAVTEEQRREMVRSCRRLGRAVKVVPDLDEILNGNGNGNGVAAEPPPAEDLLFRDPIEVDLETLRGHYQGRCVLVTGAGGSIGSEICMQVARCGPARLVLFEKHEAGLYDIERRLCAAHPDLAIDAVIGDVRDAGRLDEVFGARRPQVVFHAAAYKHVPMMEKNPGEAIKTNVLGTRRVAEAAERHGVGTFILISTDKAVEPCSVMGATKRMAELMVRKVSAGAATKFLVVRFGNVLDSSGSVIPLFREQIERGGPVTVTHPDVTRWFMTIPEAVSLILTAVTIGRGGEVFVLDMGKPVRIADLARTLIRQYGLRPDEDIAITYIGLRPGERLFEKLFNDHETVLKSPHPRILTALDVPGAAHGDGHANGNGNGNGPGNGWRSEEFHRLMRVVENGAAPDHAPELRRVVAHVEAVCV